MRAAARDAVLQGRSLILAAGGDDTVRAALFGMEEAGYFTDESLRKTTTFGILPLGTFNNFARFLGVPVDDLDAAFATAHNGVLHGVDMGRANDTLFVESAGIGLDVAAWRAFPREDPRLLRRLWDGAKAVVQALTTFRPRMYHLTIDGVPRKLRAYDITVANCDRVSAAIQIAPQAVKDDGYLDLCVIPPLSRLRFLLALPLLFAGKHTAYLRGVYYIKIKQVTISAYSRFWVRRSSVKPRSSIGVRVDNAVIQKLPLRVSVLPAILPIRLPGKAVSS